MEYKDKRLLVYYLSIFIIISAIGSYIALVVKEKKCKVICSLWDDELWMFVLWLFILLSLTIIMYVNKNIPNILVLSLFIVLILLMILTRVEKNTEKNLMLYHYITTFLLGLIIFIMVFNVNINRKIIYLYVTIISILVTLFILKNYNKNLYTSFCIFEVVVLYSMFLLVIIDTNKQLKNK